jgi:hypothetical protein
MRVANHDFIDKSNYIIHKNDELLQTPLNKNNVMPLILSITLASMIMAILSAI